MQKPKKEKPTAQETALAQVSAHQWADYVERFRPAEAEMIKRAEFTAGERAQVTGEVAADAAAAFKGQTRATHAAGGATGAKVGSGKSKFSLAADAAAAGEAKGVGQAMAVAGGIEDENAQKVRITGLGRQVATAVTADTSRGARRATRLALAASEARFQSKLDTVNAVAGVAGAAASKYKSHLDKKKANKAFTTEELAKLDASGMGISGFDFGETDLAKRSFGQMPNPFAGWTPDLGG